MFSPAIHYCYRVIAELLSTKSQHQGKAASRAAAMATRTATPAETLAAPARGFLDTCETFADEASSSSVDAAAVDRFRAEARKAAARSASDAARLEASEQAAARARIDRDRAERDARLENEVARLRRAVSNEPADMRREHSSFDRLKDLFDSLRNARRNGSRLHVGEGGRDDSDSDGFRCPPSPCWSSPVPFSQRRVPEARQRTGCWCCAADDDDRDARLVFAAPSSPLRSPPRSPLFLRRGATRGGSWAREGGPFSE